MRFLISFLNSHVSTAQDHEKQIARRDQATDRLLARRMMYTGRNLLIDLHDNQGW